MLAYRQMFQLDSQLANFLLQDSLIVARRLLGAELTSLAGDEKTGGIIVETEAYHGLEDPASHAFRGRTVRTAPMYEAGGALYVYLSFGVHNCLNIVTGPNGNAEAVLIRALQPAIGLPLMARRRGTDRPRLLTTGPGRLTQALGITLAQSGSTLGQLLMLKLADQSQLNIETGPRIGISKAKELPWRFYLAGNSYVSKP
jgi:DNA-3-methyladenine glycosylase